MSKLETQNARNIEELRCELSESQQKLKLLTPKLLSDMYRLDELLKNLEADKEILKKLRSEASSSLLGKNLATTEDELNALKLSKKAKIELLESFVEDLDSSRKTASILGEKLNELRRQKNDLDDIFRALNLDEKVRHLETTRGTMRAKELKIAENDHSLFAINANLSDDEVELQKLTTESDLQIKNQREELEGLKKSRDDIECENIEIEKLVKEKLQDKIEQNLESIEDNTNRIQLLDNELNKSSEAGQLKSLLFCKKLQENIELMNLERSKAKAQERLAGINRELAALDVSLASKAQLDIKQKDLDASSNTLSGQKSFSEKQIQVAKEEFETKFKEANKNYMMECYNEAVLTAMIKDLKNFKAVLESSLLKFHDTKMKEVNATIRHFWRKIYKGNDIDYIKILTDGSKISAEKRRTYNYRVVQVKHSNPTRELDMRDYGSAAQKVLTSLVIRMALADTFNCRILALDEPTTNLDRKNVTALCDALNAFVEEREKIGQFMLIILSHDEKFVAGLDRADHFFRLSRGREGKSVITKVDKFP